MFGLLILLIPIFLLPPLPSFFQFPRTSLLISHKDHQNNVREGRQLPNLFQDNLNPISKFQCQTQILQRVFAPKINNKNSINSNIYHLLNSIYEPVGSLKVLCTLFHLVLSNTHKTQEINAIKITLICQINILPNVKEPTRVEMGFKNHVN